MKNVILKLVAFNGGAPLSVLNYCRVLIDNSFKIVASGKIINSGIVKKYHELGIQVSDCDVIHCYNDLNVFRVIKSYKQLLKDYNNAKKLNANIIISVGKSNIFWGSFISKKLNIYHLGIIPGGKVQINDYYLRFSNCNKIVCFSQENANALKGIKNIKDELQIITNRINSEIDFNWKNHYSSLCTNKVKFFLASRMETDKVVSIISVIELTSFIFENGIDIELCIAGDGTEYEYIQKYANNINKLHQKVLIKLNGYVDDTKNAIMQSHFVFGKGRSVIEAIMMNRIGFVVGEDGIMSLCTQKSLGNISFFNFSGRNIEFEITKNQLLNMVRCAKNEGLCFEEFENAFEDVRKMYDIKYLEFKIEQIIQDFKSINGYREKTNESIKIENRKYLASSVMYYYLAGILNKFIR